MIYFPWIVRDTLALSDSYLSLAFFVRVLAARLADSERA